MLFLSGRLDIFKFLFIRTRTALHLSWNHFRKTVFFCGRVKQSWFHFKPPNAIIKIQTNGYTNSETVADSASFRNRFQLNSQRDVQTTEISNIAKPALL